MITRPRPAVAIALSIVAALLPWAAPTAAGPLADGYQARYAVSRAGLPLGESVRTLRPDGAGRWRFDARAEPTGLAAVLFDDVIEETSELLADRDGVHPLRYRYHQHGGRKEKAYELHFDWDAGLLRFLHSGEQLPLPARAQDPLSFVVALMRRLTAGERDFTLTIAGRNKLRDYRVGVSEPVRKATVLGPQPVVHIDASEIGKDTRYELWGLPDHDYLPLRIRQIRGDQVTELRLRALSTPPPVREGSP